MEQTVLDTGASLTAREREVLHHVVDGLTYTSIARRMGLSPHTVDTYVRRIRAKTGTANRTQLAVLAMTLEPGRGGLQ
ncbi:response regulator transcription factor [Streptomyces sp. NPDC057445]|uniref:response regulator transcription factor n=1 Tax=Streptomyces sp. NPDC057445 TaxID=3346136 RepID=UPI0036C8BA14